MGKSKGGGNQAKAGLSLSSNVSAIPDPKKADFPQIIAGAVTDGAGYISGALASAAISKAFESPSRKTKVLFIVGAGLLATASVLLCGNGKGLSKAKPIPPGCPSRTEFERMFDMTARDENAVKPIEGEKDVMRVKARYLKHNPETASWPDLEDELRGLLGEIRTGTRPVKPPKEKNHS